MPPPPEPKPRPERHAVLALVLLAAAAAALGAAFLVRGGARQERLAEIATQGEALLSRVTDAETGQRGFLLTGRDSYLEPYDAATAAVPADLGELARLAAAEAGLRAPVAMLQRSVPAKLDELARTVALRREAGPEPALALVETDAGKALMDAVRAQVAALRASADALRGVAQHETLWLVLGAVATAAVAAGASIVLLAGALRRGRRAEATLAEAEARFRGTFEQAAVGVAHVGLDGRWLLVNGRLCEITGYPRDELLALTFQDITHPDDLETDLAQVRALLAGRIATYAMEKRYLRKDGGEIWVNLTVSLLRGAAGRPERFISVVEDISARKGTELALAASEARLRVATEANGVGTWELLLRPGRPAAAVTSARHDAIFGYAEPLPEWNSDIFMAHVVPEDREVVGRALRDAVEAGGAWGFEARIRLRRDGEPRWIEAHGQTVERGADGRASRLVGVVMDVTERKRAVERQALLMREVDHRAKNALAVALSLVRLTPREDAGRFAGAVEGRIAAMARAHSLLAKERWAGADLRSLGEGELAAYAGRVRFAGPPVRLAAEAAQPVAMLLHELATNAAKHGALSAPGGSVELGWDLGGEGGGLRLSWRESGGPPLAGPPSRKGFGSRLVAQLAERQLGGRLALHWEPSGLHAALALPARHAAPGLADMFEAVKPPRWTGDPAAAARAVAPHEGAPRVLVVEDEALLAMELEGTLRALGFEVVGPTRSLTEALRAAAGTEPLDAAVLDVNLGNGDRSFPVVDVLATRGVPYLFATGYASAGSLEGREGGAVAVLRKPYRREALARALEQALRPPAAAGDGRSGAPR